MAYFKLFGLLDGGEGNGTLKELMESPGGYSDARPVEFHFDETIEGAREEAERKAWERAGGDGYFDCTVLLFRS